MSKKDVSVTMFAWACILPQNNTNYQNQHKQLTITRTKLEEIKRGTKINKSNGQKEGIVNRVNNGRSCEFLQPVNMPNFLQASISMHFLLFFPSSF